MSSEQDALRNFFAKKNAKKQIRTVKPVMAAVERDDAVETSAGVTAAAADRRDTTADDGWVEIQDEVVHTFNTRGKQVGDLRTVEREVEESEEVEAAQAPRQEARVWNVQKAAPASAAQGSSSRLTSERNFPTLEATVPKPGTAFSAGLMQKSINEVASTKNYFNLLEDNSRGAPAEEEAPARKPAPAAAAAPAPARAVAEPAKQDEDIDKLIEEAKALDTDKNKYANKKKKKKKADSDDDL